MFYSKSVIQVRHLTKISKFFQILKLKPFGEPIMIYTQRDRLCSSTNLTSFLSVSIGSAISSVITADILEVTSSFATRHQTFI